YYFQRPTTVHPMGGACVAANIREGVVDCNGEVFDHAGLYVADAAALPKPPGTAPSMTIAAWADHVAERLIEQLKAEATKRRATVSRRKRKARAD
ncbi:MAG: GMC oxidoreductase, partial [Phycisphaeraceae bacterium]|nr:GMC oxidoreductase [Phycisphaeraceae bacterium]